MPPYGFLIVWTALSWCSAETTRMGTGLRISPAVSLSSSSAVGSTLASVQESVMIGNLHLDGLPGGLASRQYDRSSSGHQPHFLSSTQLKQLGLFRHVAWTRWGQDINRETMSSSKGAGAIVFPVTRKRNCEKKAVSIISSSNNNDYR